MNRSIARCVAVLFTVCVVASEAHARSTGWVDGYEWVRIARTLSKNNEMPVSIVCKDTGTTDLTWKSGIAKVEIQKNPKNIKWHWAFGDSVGIVKPRVERDGFKLVSYSEFRRASGLKVACAIWHKE